MARHAGHGLQHPPARRACRRAGPGQSGPELEDRTLALKLFAGRHRTRAHPATDELLHFGRQVCEVNDPAEVLRRIAQAMEQVLKEARKDTRFPKPLRSDMAATWRDGMAHAVPS